MRSDKPDIECLECCDAVNHKGKKNREDEQAIETILVIITGNAQVVRQSEDHEEQKNGAADGQNAFPCTRLFFLDEASDSKEYDEQNHQGFHGDFVGVQKGVVAGFANRLIELMDGGACNHPNQRRGDDKKCQPFIDGLDILFENKNREKIKAEQEEQDVDVIKKRP